MAHTQDVIFTEQGLDNFIQLIKQNPQMISKIVVDNTKDDGYYLSVYGADGQDKLSTESPTKIAHKITTADTTKDGTVAFSVDGKVWDLTLHGIVDEMTTSTGGTKMPTVSAVRDYTIDYVEDYIEKYTTFIPGHATTMKEDENAPVWQVQVSTTDESEMALKALKVYGAVFNDYAEYRMAIAEAGQCVIENGDGTLTPSTRRLQLGGNIVSDTFGFAIGQTLNAKCPIAVCGRVLAYPNEPAWTYSPGAAVCSGPNGTISLMTREEIKEWPDAIIGYVSEVPTYETWGTDNIKVNGRIWIKVK